MDTLTVSSIVFLITIVRGSEPEPQFDSTPINVTAIAGQPAILPCNVDHKGGRQVIWMNPRRVLISTEDRRVIDDTRMSIERPFIRDWNLHIRHVQVEDKGEYTCQINTDPIQIKRIWLKIQVPAQIDNSTSSNNTIVREGTTVKLTCTATGIPEPTITWYRKTLNNQQAKEHVGTTGEVLVIHNISRYCGGLYECEAGNNLPHPVRRQIKVDVEFSPEVTFRTPQRMGQVRGKSVMFECFITAFPHGVSQWTRHGVPVVNKQSLKYRTEVFKEDMYTIVLTLMILNVDEDDFGLYLCEAENTLGKDSLNMTFFEYNQQTPKPTTTPKPTVPPRWPTTRYWDANNPGYISAGVGYSGGAKGLQRDMLYVYLPPFMMLLTSVITSR